MSLTSRPRGGWEPWGAMAAAPAAATPAVGALEPWPRAARAAPRLPQGCRCYYYYYYYYYY